MGHLFQWELRSLSSRCHKSKGTEFPCIPTEIKPWTQLPNFRPKSIVAKRSPISATAELVQNGGGLPSWILKNQMVNVQKFVPKTIDFLIFQNGGHPLSWI